MPALSSHATEVLDDIIEKFSVEDAQRVKNIERTTNHDVKAVEYFLKEKIAGNARNWRRSASSSTSPAPPRTSTISPMP